MACARVSVGLSGRRRCGRRNDRGVSDFGRAGQSVKRVLEVVLAATVVVLAPPQLGAIRLTSPGPAISGQEGPGLGAGAFALYTCPTLVDQAPDTVHCEHVVRLLTQDVSPRGGETGLYKLEDDRVVTRVSRWVRRARVKLRGEMSLVGPRPARPWEAELNAEDQYRRSSLLPGITGLCQGSGRSRLTMRGTLDFGVEHVWRRRMLVDLLILVRTDGRVLRWEAV